MQEKTMKLKVDMFNSKFVSHSIASNIVNLLIKSHLLKKFIKVFYYK
jgi:hypothetical protein